MAVSDAELTAAWREVLALSRVGPNQQVSILVSDDSNRQTLGAARNAATDLGAMVTVLHLPPVNGAVSLSRDKTAYMGRTPLTGNSAAMAALKTSDMVIDLMLLLFSPEQGEILESGARILLAVEPPEILVRILPTLADRSRVLAATARLEAAKVMTVTSAAGTDFRCELGEFPVLTEYGFVDEPGRWDHWPSGFVATWPNERTAQGVIVIDTGDIILPFKSYTQAPVRLTIEDGYVRAIEGGFDAEYLSEYMASFRDPEVYAMSHIGWGLQPRAQWAALGLFDREATLGMDARSFYGNFLFSTGANIEAGGQRDTACHMDVPLRRCSVFLDGEAMTRDGDVVPEDQRVTS